MPRPLAALITPARASSEESVILPSPTQRSDESHAAAAGGEESCVSLTQTLFIATIAYRNKTSLNVTTGEEETLAIQMNQI